MDEEQQQEQQQQNEPFNAAKLIEEHYRDVQERYDLMKCRGCLICIASTLAIVGIILIAVGIPGSEDCTRDCSKFQELLAGGGLLIADIVMISICYSWRCRDKDYSLRARHLIDLYGHYTPEQIIAEKKAYAPVLRRLEPTNNDIIRVYYICSAHFGNVKETTP